MQYNEDLYGAFLPVEEGSDSQEYTQEERLKIAALPLIYWFQANKRKLPWREEPTPYHVWLSEIMLQQTRVEAVIPYYNRFLERLPEIADLAQVQDEELMKLWQGLGYYNRARNLKKAARAAVDAYDGNLPGTYEELLAMPGIGPYTAGAVASIAMNLPEPAVDGNVLRVISRLWASEEDISLPAVRKKMEGMIRELLKDNAAYDRKPGPESGMHASAQDASGRRNPSLIKPSVYNQALMELGALVCIPNGAPRCEECPWEGICLAHKNNLTDRIPYKAPKKARKTEKMTVLLIRYQNRVFLRKRPAKGLLANLYELPNVKGWVTAEEAIREAREILGCENCRMEAKPLKDGKHIFTHVEWQMKGYEIIVDSADTGTQGSKVMEERSAYGDVDEGGSGMKRTELKVRRKDFTETRDDISQADKGAFYEISYINEHLAIPSAFSGFKL